MDWRALVKDQKSANLVVGSAGMCMVPCATLLKSQYVRTVQVVWCECYSHTNIRTHWLGNELPLDQYSTASTVCSSFYFYVLHK
jgi:hypothetical protein